MIKKIISSLKRTRAERENKEIGDLRVSRDRATPMIQHFSVLNPFQNPTRNRGLWFFFEFETKESPKRTWACGLD